MMRRFVRSSSVWCCLALLVFVSGCAQNGNLPPDAPEALLLGAAESPIQEALQEQVRVIPYDGSQDPSDFDLLIVDGDAFTAQQLRDEELIHRALRSGVWVLGLDVEEDDKQNGLGYLLEAATGDTSAAYLIRMSRDAGGHPSNRIVQFSETDAVAAVRQVQEILRYLKNPDVQVQQFQQDTPPEIPAELLTASYYFTTPISTKMPPAKTTSGDSQVAIWNYTTAIRIFLDNENDPTGNFQWVLAETNSSASPGTLNAWSEDEVSWSQTLFQVNLIPDQYLTLLKSEPQNVAGSKTVTTDVGFTVGFNSNGPTGSFSYSNSTTKTITDWSVENNSRSSGSPNKAAWTINSANPVDGNNTNKGIDVDPGAFCCGFEKTHVRTPNHLSTSNMEYFTQGLWTTNNQVVKDWVTFTTIQRVWYTAAWVKVIIPGKGVPYYQNYMDRYNVVSQPDLRVNLAAVVPVPIKSITFNPNPVVAGQQTTATLTLASAAPTDIVVTISSDKPGVAPEHNTYTIPKDQDSISFVINAGAEGCDPESATISAFYAEGENAILSIKPPSHCP